MIEESFLILGWVANWRPLEIFLYDWWPITRRRDLYQRLSKAIVEARPYGANQPDTGAAENLALRCTSAEETIPNSRCNG
jgi:hypothetical protein